MEFTHLSKSVIQILWCGHRKETYWSSVFTLLSAGHFIISLQSKVRDLFTSYFEQ